MANLEDWRGNYWPEESPVRSELSTEEFSRIFAGFEAVIIEMASDRVVGAGHDEVKLEEGLQDRGLNPTSYQIELGPSTWDALLPQLCGILKDEKED